MAATLCSKSVPSGGWCITTGLCADVAIVPTLQDNYAYLLIDSESKEAICVDPAEPQKILAAVKDLGLRLVSGLTTHKHFDHSGGNLELLKIQGDGFIMAGPPTECPGITKGVKDGDVIEFGKVKITVHHTPCHTTGHLLYSVTPKANEKGLPLIFTGDTVFLAGCGRFFEGNGKDMLYAMKDVMRNLADDTHMFCGHEYSVNNLKFALSVEPDNSAAEDKLQWAISRRSQGLPTIPSKVSEEKSYNPFMRTHQPSVRAAAEKYKGGKLSSEEEIMDVIRKMKDGF